MQEIQKVVQKLSREQESAARGGGVWKHKANLVYRGDFNTDFRTFSDI